VVGIPEALIRVVGIQLCGSRHINFHRGGVGAASLCVGVLLLVCFVIFRARRVHHLLGRVEALEPLHDLVHVDIEMGLDIVLLLGSGASAQVALIEIGRLLELVGDEVLPVWVEDLLAGGILENAIVSLVELVGQIDNKAHVAVADLVSTVERDFLLLAHSEEGLGHLASLEGLELVLDRDVRVEVVLEDLVYLQGDEVVPGVVFDQVDEHLEQGVLEQVTVDVGPLERDQLGQQLDHAQLKRAEGLELVVAELRSGELGLLLLLELLVDRLHAGGEKLVNGLVSLFLGLVVLVVNGVLDYDVIVTAVQRVIVVVEIRLDTVRELLNELGQELEGGDAGSEGLIGIEGDISEFLQVRASGKDGEEVLLLDYF
jgi:hypothetical protein